MSAWRGLPGFGGMAQKNVEFGGMVELSGNDAFDPIVSNMMANSELLAGRGETGALQPVLGVRVWGPPH